MIEICVLRVEDIREGVEGKDRSMYASVGGSTESPAEEPL